MDRDEFDDDVSGQLDSGDTLDDSGPADPLDEGYSPAERPWAVNDWGTTAREQATGESLAGRLARELPETDGDNDGADDGDGLGDTTDTDGETRDDEVGGTRSGRLVSITDPAGDPDNTSGADEELDLFATDIGIDGAGASAEEAAVHLIPDHDDR